MHIGATLAQLALSHPDRTAIVDDNGAWSFQRFHRRVTRFGNAMHGLGLAKGDRIALLLPDCREYLEADYGTMAAGFVRVPMDPRLTRRELVELLQRAGVGALVTHPGFAEKVEDGCATTSRRCNRSSVSAKGPASTTRRCWRNPPSGRCPRETAAILPR